MAIGYNPLDEYTTQCFKGNYIFKKSKWFWNKQRLFLIIFSWTVCGFVRHTVHVVICFLCRRKKKVYIKTPTPVPSGSSGLMNEWMNEYVIWISYHSLIKLARWFHELQDLHFLWVWLCRLQSISGLVLE